MDNRWPHYLKAFWVLDAVVRKEGFTAAAEYLNVSQSAVSQQIRLLEQEFGPLFERRGKQVRPTEVCLRLSRHLRKGFAHIEEGVASTRERLNQITLSVLPSFGAGWLLPKLHGFTSLHPDIEVRLSMSDAVADFADTGLDAGIRIGGGQYPDLIARYLCDDELFLVCCPETHRRFGNDAGLDALASTQLIHDNAREDQNWPAWVAATGRRDVKFGRRLMISDSSQVIRMALAGDGVAMVRRVLVADELAAGRLVRLFDISVKLDIAYYFVMPTRSRGHPAVEVFYQWLKQAITPYCSESGKKD